MRGNLLASMRRSMGRARGCRGAWALLSSRGTRRLGLLRPEIVVAPTPPRQLDCGFAGDNGASPTIGGTSGGVLAIWLTTCEWLRRGARPAGRLDRHRRQL